MVLSTLMEIHFKKICNDQKWLNSVKSRKVNSDIKWESSKNDVIKTKKMLSTYIKI